MLSERWPQNYLLETRRLGCLDDCQFGHVCKAWTTNAPSPLLVIVTVLKRPAYMQKYCPANKACQFWNSSIAPNCCASFGRVLSPVILNQVTSCPVLPQQVIRRACPVRTIAREDLIPGLDLGGTGTGAAVRSSGKGGSVGRSEATEKRHT